MSLSDDKKTYLLHSKMNGYRKKVEKSKEILKKALQQSKNATLSFSAGKDSIVLLDLAVKCGFSGKLVFFKYGICTDIETPKENVDLMIRYAEKYKLQYKILSCLGEVDCWEKCGRFLFRPETKQEKKIFNLTNYDFSKKSNEFEKQNKTDLTIIGMRKEESKTRKMMLNKKGAIYETKNRESKTCCPLADFTNEDIWAYIFSENLEYLKIYDYEYLDRKFIRNEVTLLYNEAILRNGIIFHYKKMYPYYFSWIAKKYGDIAF